MRTETYEYAQADVWTGTFQDTHPKRAAIYIVASSALRACLRRAEAERARVVTVVDEVEPKIGFGGRSLDDLVARQIDREFDIIVADAGAGHIVIITACNAANLFDRSVI